MNDKTEAIKIPDSTAAELELRTAHELLTCHRRPNDFDPASKTDIVYKPGMTGDDWFAKRVFNQKSNRNPPGGVGLYELKLDGKLYSDFIQPYDSLKAGEDNLVRYKDFGDHGQAVEKGSEEYNKVLDLIHNQHLFDSCERLPKRSK